MLKTVIIDERFVRGGHVVRTSARCAKGCVLKPEEKINVDVRHCRCALVCMLLLLLVLLPVLLHGVHTLVYYDVAILAESVLYTGITHADMVACSVSDTAAVVIASRLHVAYLVCKDECHIGLLYCTGHLGAASAYVIVYCARVTLQRSLAKYVLT